VGVADDDDGVGGQGGVLPDAQPGAQQELHRHPDELAPVGLGCFEQGGRGVVIECLGQGVALLGHVAGEHRDPRWCVRPGPLLDAQEEHPQRPEAVGDGRR